MWKILKKKIGRYSNIHARRWTLDPIPSRIESKYYKILRLLVISNYDQNHVRGVDRRLSFFGNTLLLGCSILVCSIALRSKVEKQSHKNINHSKE